MKRVTIKDPQGLVHVVEFDGAESFGHENLAHGFPRERQRLVMQAVLEQARLDNELPHGFSYCGASA